MSFARWFRICAVLTGICFLLACAAWAQQQTSQGKAVKTEKKVEKKAEKEDKEEAGEKADAMLAMKDLPKAVQTTIQKETQGAEIVGISKETDQGKTLYEVETKVQGHTRDMLIDPKGNLTEVEEEVALASLPAGLQAEIQKSIGKAKLVKLESVANGTKTLTGYSATVEIGGNQSSIEMGPDGKVLAKGK